ncbi:flagellin [Desulfospira joergensenii]|uniref:flagellin N-terminal helical domain-containing protein n=1 Tax=Desulfospira joergensenii TaxID=53329 RepID=UPI0003B47BDB|nr:flagellin [Desulfospira joergensenii]
MAFKINTNTMGGFSTYQLQKNQQDLSKTLQRLSTGKRINQAADDASGMAIADQLASQADSLAQAARNANDAISIVQVADGALAQASELVQDIRVKAVQAAGPAQSTESRQAIQADIDASLEALSQIADTTSFNGQKLLSGTFSDKAFQIGAASGETLEISLGSISPDQISSEDLGTLADIDVTSDEGAQNAIAMADEALAYISQQRAAVGSEQNQLESTINNLSSTRVNILSSESEIRDLDFAEESMNLNRLKILARARGFAQTQAAETGKRIIDILE